MAKRRIIDSNRILQVETTTEADKEILEHLNSTILGTPGGLRYKLSGIREKLDHIKKIHFMVLTRQGKLIGSVGLIPRNIDHGSESISSWYIRYFSIRAPLRSANQNRKINSDPSRGSTIVKDISLPYLRNPERLLENPDLNKKLIIYSYVEEGNVRSVNFSDQMHAETVRKHKTLIFNRLFLNKVKGIRRLKTGEIAGHRIRLLQFYQNYNFYTEENLFQDSNYFVLEEEDQILAAAQVNQESWRVLDMKGKVSKILLKILPGVPYIRRIFNPDDFRFLAVEGIWYRKGYENRLNELFEGLCYEFKTHFVLTWADKGSKLYQDLEQHLDSGLIASSFERTEVDVRVTFNNLSDEEKRRFYDKPAYVSAFDMV